MDEKGVIHGRFQMFHLKHLEYVLAAKMHCKKLYIGITHPDNTFTASSPNDKHGVTRFASMRGVFDKQGKPFKCDVTGNDKNYGFNVVNENSTELVVFEAAIDLMSYVDIFTDYESNKLALGMLADAPLETFLREHPQITSIRFCLDGDEPGRKAAAELMRKYYELGYEVEDCPPPAGYKDYNEWLVAAKLNLNRMNKRADEPVRA